LKQSKQILLKALRASPDSITISRLKDGTFIEVNKGFENLTGHNRSHVIGKSSLELGLWKNPASRMRLEKILKRDGMAREFETDFVIRSGEVRHCVLSAEVLELDGERCMIATVRDITDKKRADEALQWFSEKLQRERQNLVEKEAALRQVLDHIEDEKSAYRKEISKHVKNLLTPIISKMRKREGSLAQKDLDLLERSLNRIVEADIDEFQENYSKLTPREMDICAAIKEGLSSKEIADELGLSLNTVHKHRQIIRRKLLLNNKEINLAAYLRSR
jgi:PAS domain S-box-containing protein